MEIANVAIYTATRYGKATWFEAQVTAFVGDEIKRFSVDLPVSELKEMGVCKNLNGWKRVQEWANSDAGSEYIIKNKDRKSMLTMLKAQEEASNT
jgi:hypothetical protein